MTDKEIIEWKGSMEASKLIKEQQAKVYNSIEHFKDYVMKC